MKLTREQLATDVEDFVRRGGKITKCEPQKTPKTIWYRDYDRSNVLNRMGGVIPAGMVPFKRNVGKGE